MDEAVDAPEFPGARSIPVSRCTSTPVTKTITTWSISLQAPAPAKRKRKRNEAYASIVASLLLLALAAIPASAHHAFAAEFDANKPVKLRGTVTKMEWINPHAWIHIDVKKADNSVDEWMIEAGSPNTLAPKRSHEGFS